MAVPWRVAWLTGASSGIGRALALELAGRGVRVAASARRGAELAALCDTRPGITALPLDVTDLEAVRAAATRIEAELGPIDLAVLNAGIGRRMGAADLDAALAARIMAVNYQGLVNGLDALLPAMRGRRAGHIALMASLAGYRGLPRAGPYTASKAAAISLAEALEPELATLGIRLSIINPGYVATGMTAGAGRPLLWQITAEDAAGRIVQGLERGRFEIAFPLRMALLMRLVRALPQPVLSWLARRQI